MISSEFSPFQSKPSGSTMLARILTRQGHKVILLNDSGHVENGRPLCSLLKNLVPVKVVVDGITWVFPPVLRSSLARGFLKVLQAVFSIVSTSLFGTILLLSSRGAIDVIHSSTAQSHGLVGSFLKTVFHRPLVVNYGDPAFVRDVGVVREFQRLLEIATFSKSDLVLANDPVIADWVSKEYGKHTIFLPNGYDADLFRGATDHAARGSGFKVITFVGKIDLSIYRLDILLKAIRLLRDEFPNVRLRVIGNGPSMIEVKSLARQLDVETCVEFVGLVPHEEVPRWVAESDICVHISSDTCLGNKVLEYMAARKPVIIAAPWWNRYSQFLENRVNCVMVPLIAEELARAMAELLASPRTAEMLAVSAFRTVSRWSWDTVCQERIVLMKELSERWGRQS